MKIKTDEHAGVEANERIVSVYVNDTYVCDLVIEDRTGGFLGITVCPYDSKLTEVSVEQWSSR